MSPTFKQLTVTNEVWLSGKHQMRSDLVKSFGPDGSKYNYELPDCRAGKHYKEESREERENFMPKQLIEQRYPKTLSKRVELKLKLP